MSLSAEGLTVLEKWEAFMEVPSGVHALLYNVYALKRLLTHGRLVMRTLPANFVEKFAKRQGFDFLQSRYFNALGNVHLEADANKAFTQTRLLKYIIKAMTAVIKR